MRYSDCPAPLIVCSLQCYNRRYRARLVAGITAQLFAGKKRPRGGSQALVRAAFATCGVGTIISGFGAIAQNVGGASAKMIERTLIDRVFESVLAMDLDVLDGSRSELEDVVSQMTDGYRSMLHEVVTVPTEMLRNWVRLAVTFANLYTQSPILLAATFFASPWLTQFQASLNPALQRLGRFIGRLVGDEKTQRVLSLIQAADTQTLDVHSMLENMQHVRGSAQEKYMLKRLKKQQAMQVRVHMHPPSCALRCLRTPSSRSSRSI